MELGLLGLSENLLAEVRRDTKVEIVSPALDLQFDSQGNLPDLTEMKAAIAGSRPQEQVRQSSVHRALYQRRNRSGSLLACASQSV